MVMQIFPPVPSYLVSNRTGGNYDLVTADGQVLPVFFAPGGPPNPGLVLGGIGESDITPTTAGKLLAVMAITPLSTGAMFISGNFSVESSGDLDTVSVEIAAVEDLTSVTGGQVIAPNIYVGSNVAPLTVDPAFPSSWSAVFAGATSESVIDDENVAYISFANVPITFTVGQQGGVAFFVVSSAADIEWLVGLTLTAQEVGD